MSGCGDLCSVARCDELERQIDRLQSALQELEDELQSHINLQIPYSHDVIPNFDVRTSLDGSNLTTKVVLFGRPIESTVTLPDSVVPTVAVEVVPQDNYNHQIVVTVNDSASEAILTTHKPVVDFGIEDLGEKKYAFGLFYDNEAYGTIFDLSDLAAENLINLAPEFSIDLDYNLNFLVMSVTIDDVTERATVYIDADVINRFGSGGSGINTGDEEVGCQQLADELKVDLGEILAAIAALGAQVTQVKETVTVEVEAYALSEFDCPKDDGGDGAENNAAQVKDYKLATLPALHQQLQYMNQNQVAMFERICEGGGVLAMPDWWQVRLGSKVPQIVCSFRKGATSTYHSLSVPHPADTERPIESLFPSYTKGNWQGMVVCKDNSKFIINCVNAGEATVMCNRAIELIDPNWLEQPPRVYIGERKGQAVGIAPMIPAVIQYFETGQQNTVPQWRVRVADLE